MSSCICLLINYSVHSSLRVYVRLITFTTFKVDLIRSNAELAILIRSALISPVCPVDISVLIPEGVGGACLVNSSMNSLLFEVGTPLRSRNLKKVSRLKSVRSSKYDWTKGATGSVGVSRTFRFNS